MKKEIPRLQQNFDINNLKKITGNLYLNIKIKYKINKKQIQKKVKGLKHYPSDPTCFMVI